MQYKRVNYFPHNFLLEKYFMLLIYAYNIKAIYIQYITENVLVVSHHTSHGIIYF